MKTYNQFINENVHYLNNADIKHNFEFIIDVKNATQDKINLAFREFEKYTELEEWLKKHLVSKDNGGKVWAWRIELRKGWGFKQDNLPYFMANIITSPGWGMNQGMVIIDNRITIEEFIEVGLLGVEEYIKSNNTYFNVLNRFGYTISDITPEEFIEVGVDGIQDHVEMKKNADKYNV